MHTYKQENAEWTVGYHAPRSDADGTHYKWVAIRRFASEESAAAYASYLNGGERP